jgi:hypothetical protein
MTTLRVLIPEDLQARMDTVCPGVYWTPMVVKLITEHVERQERQGVTDVKTRDNTESNIIANIIGRVMVQRQKQFVGLADLIRAHCTPGYKAVVWLMMEHCDYEQLVNWTAQHGTDDRMLKELREEVLGNPPASFPYKPQPVREVYDEQQDAPAETQPFALAYTGAGLITKERIRQIGEEGFDAAHDALTPDGALAQAAVCYIIKTVRPSALTTLFDKLWPWSTKWWKPKDPMRNLVRAGALIAAEIDRMLAVEKHNKRREG